MIRSIGLDIVEVSRIQKDIDRYGDKFINRILGEVEREKFDTRVDKAQFLSGRFAAKEAIIKALGAFFTERPDYSDLQIVNDKSGQPEFRIPDNLKEKLSGIYCMISISHETNYAAAVAVFAEEK